MRIVESGSDKTGVVMISEGCSGSTSHSKNQLFWQLKQCLQTGMLVDAKDQFKHCLTFGFDQILNGRKSEV